MMRCLKMPDALACFCIECQQTIGKKVLTWTISSIKIKRRRCSWYEYDASLFVQCHSCPAISTTVSLACISAPCICSKLTGLWDNMKDPFQFPGVDIKC